MVKRTWVATFSDGDVDTRTSSRNYQWAWRVIGANGRKFYGYSSTANLARNAAANAVRWYKGELAIVQTTTGDKPSKATLPWRIKMFRVTGRPSSAGYVHKSGNTHARFATKEEADAVIAQQTNKAFTYEAVK